MADKVFKISDAKKVLNARYKSNPKNPLKPIKIISEMEGIQYLPKNNCLLLAVTWHLYNNGLDFDKLFSQLGDISLSDLTAYLRDHNIPDNSDPIDLYCLDL